jgi:hypothetical protein
VEDSRAKSANWEGEIAGKGMILGFWRGGWAILRGRKSKARRGRSKWRKNSKEGKSLMLRFFWPLKGLGEDLEAERGTMEKRPAFWLFAGRGSVILCVDERVWPQG